MFWFFIFTTASILYFKKDLRDNLMIKILVLYSFLERYATNYITRLGIYLNPGFKVYKFLYHNYNRNGIIKLQLLKTPVEINNYVNKLMGGQVIIHYRLNH